MRRFFILLYLTVFSVFCFSQQNSPLKIIGTIPDKNSAALYQIQVGAFKIIQNAEIASRRLRSANFNPAQETYRDFTRVMITGIAAPEIAACLEKIRAMGFREVIIRQDPERRVTAEKRETVGPERAYPQQEAVVQEDPGKRVITEKWQITTPGSPYSSFEFNQDKNYIVIESQSYDFGALDPVIHFGEYTMPDGDTVELAALGVLKINTDTDSTVGFSFTAIDEPGKQTAFEAVKAESMPETPETMLLCKTWNLTESADNGDLNKIVLFSRTGTYLVVEPDGYPWLSQWRWYGENRDEIEYSPDNWRHYGRAKIVNLDEKSLVLDTPGYYDSVEGYSSADAGYIYELVPRSE
ncbi:MAG: SPOR domain-containing protein [Treponema sp.]|jgi:hypothetical protein|nr:SPOR domain-containing protein [Treponema sp.]